MRLSIFPNIEALHFRAVITGIELLNQGIKLYPEIRLEDGSFDVGGRKLCFGVPELNELLHGGVEQGTNTFITGSSGVGKTRLNMLLKVRPRALSG